MVLSFVLALVPLDLGAFLERHGSVDEATGPYAISASLVVAGVAIATAWPTRSTVDRVAVFGSMILVCLTSLIAAYFGLTGWGWGIVVLVGGVALTLATLWSRKSAQAEYDDRVEALEAKRDEQGRTIRKQADEIEILKAGARTSPTPSALGALPSDGAK
ncbi:hypothetical protein [Frondihabitans sp. VKM Ac-2883]|uniref:hypothetical protein n=1 Tax=Frondihabitans sp. VKM Ac-2883 TaxID=2783823 RepID=UPI00188A04EC|nr:hypothetical protein [Frondihabitans sp. VKM Ac-2883]MBF4575186.1 hypothetical protein [Frondihabitans sp. VKM Ac-2883]